MSYEPQPPKDYWDDRQERQHEHDEAEDWDRVPYRWIGIVFIGVVLGIGAFIGILIGAVS